MNENKHYKAIIIGSGPAGLTAAIYLSRAAIKPLVIAGSKFGGQLMWTNDVENYPGFHEGVKGPVLMSNMLKQAEKFGTEVVYDNATKVDLTGKVKKVYVGDVEYTADAVVLSSGASPRMLDIPSEQKLIGRGVSTCATCDGAFYKDKIVAVVGGGDSAAEESTFITKFASKVYLVVRKDEMRASKIMQDRVKANDKIEILWNTQVQEVLGDQTVTGIKIINNKTDKVKDLDLNGLFLAIGHTPNSEFFKGSVQTDDAGYVVSGNKTQTSVEGVFVAGELVDHKYKQAVTSAASGCMAALDLEKYLEN